MNYLQFASEGIKLTTSEIVPVLQHGVENVRLSDYKSSDDMGYNCVAICLALMQGNLHVATAGGFSDVSDAADNSFLVADKVYDGEVTLFCAVRGLPSVEDRLFAFLERRARDQRVVVTGQGLGGAEAQRIVARLLKSDRLTMKEQSKILCVTFNAPPALTAAESRTLRIDAFIHYLVPDDAVSRTVHVCKNSLALMTLVKNNQVSWDDLLAVNTEEPPLLSKGRVPFGRYVDLSELRGNYEMRPRMPPFTQESVIAFFTNSTCPYPENKVLHNNALLRFMPTRFFSCTIEKYIRNERPAWISEFHLLQRGGQTHMRVIGENLHKLWRFTLVRGGTEFAAERLPDLIVDNDAFPSPIPSVIRGTVRSIFGDEMPFEAPVVMNTTLPSRPLSESVSIAALLWNQLSNFHVAWMRALELLPAISFFYTDSNPIAEWIMTDVGRAKRFATSSPRALAFAKHYMAQYPLTRWDTFSAELQACWIELMDVVTDAVPTPETELSITKWMEGTTLPLTTIKDGPLLAMHGLQTAVSVYFRPNPNLYLEPTPTDTLLDPCDDAFVLARSHKDLLQTLSYARNTAPADLTTTLGICQRLLEIIDYVPPVWLDMRPTMLKHKRDCNDKMPLIRVYGTPENAATMHARLDLKPIVMLRGRTGSGKSTLCEYMMHPWAPNQYAFGPFQDQRTLTPRFVANDQFIVLDTPQTFERCSHRVLYNAMTAVFIDVANSQEMLTINPLLREVCVKRTETKPRLVCINRVDTIVRTINRKRNRDEKSKQSDVEYFKERNIDLTSTLVGLTPIVCTCFDPNEMVISDYRLFQPADIAAWLRYVFTN